MEERYKPVIIVVAYNRIKPLERLFHSLEQSHYPFDVKLIVSIDHSPGNEGVSGYVHAFNWSHGEKEIICRKENMGIKAHIIACADLVDQYDSVIILEDDLYVSPHFYTYAQKALDYYARDERIAGISLYNYPAIEKREDPLPFTPVQDNSDVYFIQYAASWGQAWTRKQWHGFKEWLGRHTSFAAYWGKVPFNVMDWPLTSWKKYFITYMIEQEKFFVFPTISLSTNFDDKGSNRSNDSHELQSPLKIDDRPLQLKSLSESFNVYDAFFELLPEKMNRFCSGLSAYNYDVDLYGIKRDFELKKEYVLTTKKCNQPIRSFGRYLKPHEMNIIFSVPGNDISFCRRSDILDFSKDHRYAYFVSDFNYFHRKPLTFKDMLNFTKYRLNNKLKRVISQ